MISKRSGWLIYLLSVFVAAWFLIRTPAQPGFEVEKERSPSSAQIAVIQSEFISGGFTKEVHSATAVELANGSIGVFWYAGSREGSADTAIYSRFLEKSSNTKIATWSKIRKVVDRSDSIRHLRRHIRKLGNPVVLDHNDRLWLFYVTVSVGGWGASSINLITSSDQGKSWSDPKRLITSPFINISTLVKERAVIATDDGLLLPVYHEFIGKFAELLHLDPQGEVVDKYRISHGKEAIQPMVVPFGEKEAVVFLRNATESESSAILASQTDDGGRNWEPSFPLQLPNPNAAITSVVLDSPNQLLLVFNNDEEQRSDLTLAYAKDYQSGASGQWQMLYEFENDSTLEPGEEKFHNPYSYPFLIKTRSGDFHLFYSWKRSCIKHVFFNRAALNEMLTNTPHAASSQTGNVN